ncbi:MAG TPA: AAA family ATPase [Stellaceae bacterium]|nr:AAA family ATPase [Stellaceae bacterium]
MAQEVTRNTVFVAGGQPSITYVEREELEIEGHLARAVALPNQVVSLSGPTKCGKTVLCRRVLAQSQYIWIEGGQVATADDIWEKICYELNFPDEISITEGTQAKAEFGSKFIVSASGSHLASSQKAKKYKIDSMASAIRSLRENEIILVIDDFHYLPPDSRTEFLRNVKGPVFNGLGIILLSVTHRQFDAIKAESELIGRFTSVTVPEWDLSDLKKIAEKGFSALNINAPGNIVDKLADESQNSPFLMQKLCWEICYGLGVDKPPMKPVAVSEQYDLATMYTRIAKDFGIPIFEKLEVGPQSRKLRLKRPLVWGGDADIYQAILIAIAQTGPTSSLSYDELRRYA